jgi:hypothetical protein
MDFLRSYADHIGAMMCGHTTLGKNKGNWKNFKQSCYASKEAITAINNSPKGWELKGAGVVMEHVVPINVIGKHLLGEKDLRNRTLNCAEIIEVFKALLIPCLITKKQDELLRGRHLGNSMHDKKWKYCSTAKNQWDRYKAVPFPDDESSNLFSSIVAINPPSWMDVFGINKCETAKNLPSKLTPVIPQFCCNCNEAGKLLVAQG